MFPTGEEATGLLQLFRTKLAPLFPFVVIEPHIEPEILHHENRMLYMAVMMAACQSDVQRQLDLARAFRDELSRAAFVRGEMELGVLEGLLVYAGW